jgi:hypothetical protein
MRVTRNSAPLAAATCQFNDMGGGTSEESYTAPNPPPSLGTDAVIRYFGDRPTQYQRSQLKGDDLEKAVAEQKVFIPETGAAKYMYVDPRATGIPSPNARDPQSEELMKLQEALRRIGVVPEGQTGF